jgi:nucleoside-diphosphate-sugar epimerase
MRALVTGAGGFIGGHVVRTLAAAGAEVRALYRNPASVIDLPREVDFVRGDIRDFELMRRAVEGCDAVFHLAALYSYARGDAMMMESVNVEGTRTVLHAALRGRRRRIIHTSSCATCGQFEVDPPPKPISPRRPTAGFPTSARSSTLNRSRCGPARDGGEVVVPARTSRAARSTSSRSRMSRSDIWTRSSAGARASGISSAARTWP